MSTVKRFTEWLLEELDRQDFRDLERFADDHFSEIGLDVVFTQHFKDRVNDARNGAPVSYDELEDLLLSAFNKAGRQLERLPADSEAVLKQLATWLNVPVKVIDDPEHNERDLVLKTIMRKRRFETPNPEIRI
jgi:hypothetical protein